MKIADDRRQRLLDEAAEAARELRRVHSLYQRQAQRLRRLAGVMVRTAARVRLATRKSIEANARLAGGGQ